MARVLKRQETAGEINLVTSIVHFDTLPMVSPELWIVSGRAAVQLFHLSLQTIEHCRAAFDMLL
jgi:hypothetical protein